jgi:hypothetical protein
MKTPSQRIENGTGKKIGNYDLSKVYFHKQTRALYATDGLVAVRVPCVVEASDVDHCTIDVGDLRRARVREESVNTSACILSSALITGEAVAYPEISGIKDLIDHSGKDLGKPTIIIDAGQLLRIAKSLHTHTRGKNFFVALWTTDGSNNVGESGDGVARVVHVKALGDRANGQAVFHEPSAVTISNVRKRVV